MSVEAAATKAVADTTRTGVRLADAALKKAWSILDAAAEKRSPSEVLSSRAISAMQGKAQG